MSCLDLVLNPSRKKALSGPGAASSARPEVLYVIGVSIEVSEPAFTRWITA
jgi:hypothetical protein